MSTIDPEGAQAAIMARLLGAAYREPLPGIASRTAYGRQLLITTNNGHQLTAPLTAPFADPGTLTVHIDGTATQDPTEVAALLAQDNPHCQRLIDEISHSVAGLRDARATAVDHPAAAHLWDTAQNHHRDSSVYFEQLVVDGHPLHPLCRTRIGLDAARYAPEHHPDVELAMTPVDRAHATGDWPWHDIHDRPLLPVHPAQLDRHPPRIRPTHSLTAAPLMSLRTLALNSYAELHVKTSLDVQLTSARRRVSADACHNGPILSRALQSTGELLVQREVGSCASIVDGRPSPHLAAIARQSPVAILPQHHFAIPLASLAAIDPRTRRPLIATVITTSTLDPVVWWQRCVHTLLVPLLKLAQRGIGLEAHGQNTLLAVHNGCPQATIYRDFGGVRLHRRALDALGIDTLHGDLTTHDPAVVHTKLMAAVCVALMQLVNALRLAYPHATSTWWRPVAEIAASVDDPLLRAALFAPTWPVKATTAMRLSHDPTFDQWATVANPIAGPA